MPHPTIHSRYRHSRLWGLIAGLLLLSLAILCSLSIGSHPIPLTDILAAFQVQSGHDDLILIVRELRMPRTLAAILAGLALGAAGSIMQAVTRNPLAEPGLLGINAGAALAVILGVVLFNLSTMVEYVWLAFLGAGLSGLTTFALGQVHETGTNPVRLVLAGAALTIMFASITGIVILNAPPEVFDNFRHWSAGSLEGIDPDNLPVLAVTVGSGLTLALCIVSSLNALALGNDLGRALGVHPQVTWLLACLTVMLLAGAATASAGPIGFIGLAAPHVARLLVGPDQRWIMPYSALFAAVLLLGADVVARIVAAPSEVPAGVIVLLIGGPFFIAMARRFQLARL